MLAYKYRFHSRSKLRRLYKNSQRTVSDNFHSRFTISPRSAPPRLAVVVSKKVMKSAVRRNRIRRRIYEVLRHSLSIMPPGLELVIIVRNGNVLHLDHADLYNEIHHHLQTLLHDSKN